MPPTGSSRRTGRRPVRVHGPRSTRAGPAGATCWSVAAGGWALLPAVLDLGLPFPRGFVTVGLAALAFLLTLAEWLSTFEGGFSLFALLTVLAASAALAVAVHTLLPRLRPRPWHPIGQQPAPATEHPSPGSGPPPGADRGPGRPGGATASGAGADPSA